MRFLFDTNVLIPAEPTRESDVEQGTAIVSQLLGLISHGGHQAHVHPASRQELSGDRDVVRREMRLTLLSKYPELPAAPMRATRTEEKIGPSRPASHDSVDNLLIEAVLVDSVDYLVTEDTGILNKAARIGLENRIVRPADAASIVRGLFRTVPEPPPAVKQVLCHELESEDPIFEAFRESYGLAEFDRWLTRCKRHHRRAWIVKKTEEARQLAALCIVKDESAGEHGLPGSLLKICSLAVANDARGFRYGELLLKAVFHYATKNPYDWLYVEIFEYVGDLIALFEDFGFRRRESKTVRDGELVLAKPLRFTPDEYASYSPLEFNVRFGPAAVKPHGVPLFVVPIQPQYHDLLFPEEAPQTGLFVGRFPFGNSISKAYLCKAQARSIAKGSLLLFYRSGGLREACCTGVVDDVVVSRDALELARFVGKRTVYSLSEIQEMAGGEVLAILFRQAKTLRPAIHLRELVSNGALGGVPQSIVQIKERGLPWISARLIA